MRMIMRDMLIVTIVAGLLLVFIHIISKKVIFKYGYYWRKLSWILLLYMLLFPVCHLGNIFINLKSQEEQSFVVEIRDNHTAKLNENHNLGISENQFFTRSLNKMESLKTGLYRFSEKYSTDILWIWAGGMLVFESFHILIKRKVNRSLQLFSKEVKNNDILSAFSMTQKDLNIRRPVQIKYCEQIESPVTSGIFLPTVYIPENMELSYFEWRTVFRHELYHCRAYDLLCKQFIEFVQVVLWFHPLVYYIKKHAYEDMEYVCDENVTRNMCHFNVKKYCSCILKIAPIRQEGFTAFRSSKEKLKDRIDNCFEAKKRKRSGLFVIGINLLIIILCLAGTTGLNYLWAEDVSEETKVELIIPSATEIIQNGYPVNEKGETYGPASYWIWDENVIQPDLQLAEGENGVTGYIRLSEIDELDGHNNVHMPEDAVEYMKRRASEGDITVNMYLQDGETVIGKFVIQN